MSSIPKWTALRTAFDKISMTVADFRYHTKADGQEVSVATITKALTGSQAISRRKANAIIRTLNRLSRGNYTRESFPEMRIIEEEQTTEEDHQLAATA